MYVCVYVCVCDVMDSCLVAKEHRQLMMYSMIRWPFSFQLVLSREATVELNSFLQEQGHLERKEKVFLI